MDSCQAPDGGTDGQNHHSNAVASNAVTAHADTFHYFLAMPRELQDMVWEEALEPPSVLCFTVNCTRSPEDQTQ